MDQYLQVFITVVEKKNFSRAAEELHMTQPAVSQYIRTFEDSIGTRLLERTNKYVRLNKAGEIVYHHAREILGLYTTMQNLVDDLVNNARGPLLIGASYTFGEYVLPRVIANMKKVYPAIEPAVTIGNTADIANLAATHQLDAGIVEGHIQEQQVEIEEFAEDHMVIVCAADHPLAGRKNDVHQYEIENETWLVREQGSGTREAIERVFQKLKIEPKKVMTFGSNQSIKEAVDAGLGISLLSKWAVRREAGNGDLHILHMKGMPFSRQFSIVTNSPFQTKALEVFIAQLKKGEFYLD